MKYRPIVIDNAQQELTEHGTEDFPMSMDEQPVVEGQNTQVAHWHYEIQIALVTAGAVVFRTPAGDFPVLEGQGIFINSACLHSALPGTRQRNAYVCVNFHPKLIYGHSGSSIRRDYVDPVLFSAELQAIPLTAEPWHGEICALLRQMAAINDAQEYGYELEQKMRLCQIWKLLLDNNRPLIEGRATVTFAEKQRIRTLLSYIQQNYAEPLSLEDIAASAHISRGECCRIFKRVLHTTPFLYLIGFRITQSVKLLSTTDASIADIAQRVGFGSSSYYTECFKREMQCTPNAYRKQLRQNAD